MAPDDEPCDAFADRSGCPRHRGERGICHIRQNLGLLSSAIPTGCWQWICRACRCRSSAGSPRHFSRRSAFWSSGLRCCRARQSRARCSWLIWSVVASLAAAGSWQAGATWPLAGAVMNAFGCITMLILSWKYGQFEPNRVDLTCLAAATVGVGVWLITSNPVAGLMLFLAADACGALPTLRNVAIDPQRESIRGWALLALAGIAAVLSVDAQQWRWSCDRLRVLGRCDLRGAGQSAVVASIVLTRAVRRAPATTPSSANAA